LLALIKLSGQPKSADEGNLRAKGVYLKEGHLKNLFMDSHQTLWTIVLQSIVAPVGSFSKPF
jgi:hypothetical protein